MARNVYDDNASLELDAFNAIEGIVGSTSLVQVGLWGAEEEERFTTVALANFSFISTKKKKKKKKPIALIYQKFFGAVDAASKYTRSLQIICAVYQASSHETSYEL